MGELGDTQCFIAPIRPPILTFREVENFATFRQERFETTAVDIRSRCIQQDGTILLNVKFGFAGFMRLNVAYAGTKDTAISPPRSQISFCCVIVRQRSTGFSVETI
jgi:hypothetical protein